MKNKKNRNGKSKISMEKGQKEETLAKIHSWEKWYGFDLVKSFRQNRY